MCVRVCGSIFLHVCVCVCACVQLAQTKATIGFLYGGYRLSVWWFEMIDLIQKLLLTSVLAFFPSDSQLAVGMVIAVLFLIALLNTNPYIRGVRRFASLFLSCLSR